MPAPLPACRLCTHNVPGHLVPAPHSPSMCCFYISSEPSAGPRMHGILVTVHRPDRTSSRPWEGASSRPGAPGTSLGLTEGSVGAQDHSSCRSGGLELVVAAGGPGTSLPCAPVPGSGAHTDLLFHPQTGTSRAPPSLTRFHPVWVCFWLLPSSRGPCGPVSSPCCVSPGPPPTVDTAWLRPCPGRGTRRTG